MNQRDSFNELKFISCTSIIGGGATDDADMSIGWVDAKQQLHFEVIPAMIEIF